MKKRIEKSDDKINIIFFVIFGIILAFILVMALFGFANGGKAQAHEQHCLCHNVRNNPHEVCSDDDSYKQGHQQHLNSGFDTLGRCPQPTATPTVTPTATPTATPTPEVTPEVTPTAEVTPEVTPTPKEDHPGTPPTFAGSSTEAPRCGEGDVTKPVANPHVYRKGDKAVVKWFPTAGDQVHVYYKVVGNKEWQYSVSGQNIGYMEINGLGTLDITFGIQQVDGCSGGVTADVYEIVDGNTSGWVLFR